MLERGDIDVLARLTTHNMERDVYESTTGSGFAFTVPYLYNGLSYGGDPAFVGCADSRDVTTGNCTELKMCVLDFTTHVPIMTSIFPGSVVLTPSIEQMYQRLIDGSCNIIAGEQFEISLYEVRNQGYDKPYVLSADVLSKEPIAMVTRETDPRWSDFVNWVLVGLMHAEGRNARMSNPALLGDTALFGTDLRLMFVDAVTAVGNYGEMYERNLERIVPRSTINTLNPGDQPLIYSFPYGNSLSEGNFITPGGTIDTIVQRGRLRCGINVQPGFARINPATQEWSGFDVDYCRAIAAALFNGVLNVDFIPIEATGRFPALDSGDVDVLCHVTTATAQRDVYLPQFGHGFAFTQTTFYDGLAFGGRPP